jgi:hypothetical protein
MSMNAEPSVVAAASGDPFPRLAIRVAAYRDLEAFLRGFAHGHLNLLILLGGPGLGKSQKLRQVLGNPVCWLEGSASAFGIYRQLWEHRHQLVVLDDVDSLYADRDGVRLLKSLAQTDPTKTVAWHSEARALQRDAIPRQFRTCSRVAILGNRWRTGNADVAALQDRGHVVVFQPSALEVHQEAARWFWDQEVFDFVSQCLHLFSQPSLRHYVAAWELKRAGVDWRGLVLSRCLSGKPLLVAQLKANPGYATEEARSLAFIAAGGGCRATYFNLARQLRPVEFVPYIRLTTTDPPRVATPPRSPMHGRDSRPNSRFT